MNNKKKGMIKMALNGYKIFIDAGHGGTDPGASGNGLVEKTIALDIATRLQTELQKLGATTRMSRTTDILPSIDSRINSSNSFGANIFVSIHNNSAAITSANGIETLVGDNASKNTINLAKTVSARLASRLGASLRSGIDTGVKRAPADTGRYVKVVDTAYNKAWAILPEILFLSNATDASKLNSATNRQVAAEAIASGINTFAGTLPPIN